MAGSRHQRLTRRLKRARVHRTLQPDGAHLSRAAQRFEDIHA
jgi:hypothetical protein